MPRAFWRGAISFGLVHIPVGLYTATRSAALDLDFLDRRDFSPVGYERINKRTGKPVEWSDIVRGYQYEKGRYVALSDEDFRRANVKGSKTIEISGFTPVDSIEARYYETPYSLVPEKGGEKVYVLLREVLRRTGKAGIAQVVIRTRQHLAVVLADERLLTLNTLRYADELHPPRDVELPAASGRGAGIAARELAMAERLVNELSVKWQPARYHDTYREDLMRRIEEKVRKGQTHSLPRAGREVEPAPAGGAKVIDLMSVLKRSLRQNGPVSGGDRDTGREQPLGRPNHRRSSARSSARTSGRSAASPARRRRPARA